MMYSLYSVGLYEEHAECRPITERDIMRHLTEYTLYIVKFNDSSPRLCVSMTTDCIPSAAEIYK